MTNKTYNQYCSIAYALDVVGDRWSLLLVRNLLSGSKRFSDLMTGLPGISTNILTKRLKTLEENQVITTRYLPAPAASTVYELTELGYGLTESLTALAQWGARDPISKSYDQQKVVPESIIFMLYGVFWREVYLEIDLNLRFQILEDDYVENYDVHLSSTGIQVDTTTSETSDINITIGLDALLQWSSQQVTISHLMNDKLITIEDTSEKLPQFLSWVR